MLDRLNENNELEYQKLSPEEQTKRGILGRLTGIIADFKAPTRNGRRYSESLWDKTFDDPIMKEKIANRCLFGELGHPADREEIDMEKIAICLAEPPKKGKDGKLYGIFDILNTPNGKILKTLCDYGCKIGVSSRGSGDTFIDTDGQESVDPSTYTCECFDAVLIPAVKEARLQYVTESLNNKKTLKQVLCEELENASADDRKVMQDTLKELDIDVDTEQNEGLGTVAKVTAAASFVAQHWDDILKGLKDLGIAVDEIDDNVVNIINRHKELKNSKTEDCNNDSCENTELEVKPDAVDNAKADVVEELQEALKHIAELESKTIELNEKLSVCYAKETKQDREVDKYKKAISRLSEKSNQVSALQEKVSKLTSEKEDMNKQLNENIQKVQKLDENASLRVKSISCLKEDIQSKKQEIRSLNESVDKLNQEKESLNQKVAGLKKDLELKKSEYSSKIEKANSIVENYKKIANKAVDKYIESEAVKLGISVNEIKNRLPESYSFKDIDSICEDLQSFKVSMNNLPFQTNLRENMKVKLTSSKNENILPAKNIDDEVDESLLSLAGLK